MLAAELWPRLVPRLSARLAAASAALEEAERALEQASASAGGKGAFAWARANDGEPVDLHAAGWCLAALASARGHDALLARREADGPRWLVELVLERAADGASALELVPGTQALPRANVAVGAGYELALGLAYLFHRARCGGGKRVKWTQRQTTRGRWIELGETRRTAREEGAWGALVRLLPGGAVGPIGAPLALCVPHAWLGPER